MKKRQKKKFALIGLVLIVLAFFFVPMFTAKPTMDESQLGIQSTGSFNADSFFANDKYINIKSLFGLDFVSQSSFEAIFYKKTYTSGVNYKWMNAQVEMGKACDTGEAIRFFICSDKSNKNTCITDMFDNLWYVESDGNYLKSQNFYIDDLEFAYYYVCYDPQGDIVGADLGFEHSYLYNDRCVTKLEANGKGTDYETEKYCLEALENKVNEQVIDEQEIQLEKEKVACLSSDGTWTSRDTCEYPPEDASAREVCEDSGKVWTGVTCITPTTTTTTGTTGTTTTTSTTDTTDTTTSTGNTGTTTTTNNDGVTLCKDYEILVNGMYCEFSLPALFSDSGAKQYYDDNQIAVIIAIGVVIISIPIIIIGRKK